MKIGYACINTEINCTSNSTFRLSSYSESKLKEKIKQNLDCLKKILEWNIENKIYFFRIGSSLIPFASHAINKFNWQKEFQKEFSKISRIIHQNKIRITMHPDQFVVLNSQNKQVIKNSIKEILYHAQVLDALKLNHKAKIVIHIGGVYGNKEKAIQRFIQTYKKLPQKIKNRLIIENDDKSYSIKDCLQIHKETKIPICFDIFHHQCLNNNETLNQCFNQIKKTWEKSDGSPILHYSEQKTNGKKGSHSQTISPSKFNKTISQIKSKNFNIMLEVKDKEQSVLKIMRKYY
jgi:UV DNA damage endonuclease